MTFFREIDFFYLFFWTILLVWPRDRRVFSVRATAAIAAKNLARFVMNLVCSFSEDESSDLILCFQLKIYCRR